MVGESVLEERRRALEEEYFARENAKRLMELKARLQRLALPAPQPAAPLFPRIMLPLDGSALAEQPLPLARALAAALGAQLTLARAVPVPREAIRYEDLYLSPEELLVRLRGDAGSYLANEVAKLAPQDDEPFSVTSELLLGSPGEALAALVRARDISLIVMATHGRSGLLRFSFGSVTEAMLRTGVPLLVQRPLEPAPTAPATVPRRLLLPLDGSPLGEKALPTATRLAQALGATLLLYRASMVPYLLVGSELVTPPRLETWQEVMDSAEQYLQEQAELLRGRGFTVETFATLSNAGDGILEAAAALDADMIVMSTHGHTGWRRALYGSVADHVLRHSPRPVLLLRPTPDVPAPA